MGEQLCWVLLTEVIRAFLRLRYHNNLLLGSRHDPSLLLKPLWLKYPSIRQWPDWYGSNHAVNVLDGFFVHFYRLCDQMVVILNRMSILEKVRVDADRLKGGLLRKQGYRNFKITFGSEFGWRWFIPLRNFNPLTMEDLYN